MRVSAALATLGLAASLTACAASPPTAPGKPRSLDASLANLLVSECAEKSAIQEGRAFLGSLEFEQLDADGRRAFGWLLVECAFRQGDYRAAIAIDGQSDARADEWVALSRLAIAVEETKPSDGLDAFQALAKTSPRRARAQSFQLIGWLLRGARDSDASGDRALAMHDTIARVRWQPPAGFYDDGLRIEHARLLLDRHRVEAARERLSGIVGAQHAIAIRVDERFAALREDPTFAAKLDVERAASADLARSQRDALANPRVLRFVVDQSERLRILGRGQAAIELIERALRVDGDDATHFGDRADHVNWALNELADALYEANRPEEAHAALERAMTFDEGRSPNISQTINYSMALSDEGQPERALEVVGRLGRASRYGEMWAAAARVCAYEQLGDRARRDEALAFLAANESANPAARTRGLLCTNDLDGAAALYLRRLADPAQRGDALEALQIYRMYATPALPQRGVLVARLGQVRERPEVQRAVLAVGRIEEIPLYATYYGDL